MSYPDLGCFSECLTCELCGAPPPGSPGWPGPSIFDVAPDYIDPSWDDDPDWLLDGDEPQDEQEEDNDSGQWRWRF